MYHKHIKADSEFKIVAATERSQAAVMALEAGQSTGSTNNMHLKSDQWLYVVSGNGKAIIEDLSIDLKPGVLVLIEAGEVHEIFASPTENLTTINIYAPPEYPADL
ncbi:cupin domain-containing protein [Chitinispirillales bacterium ANBcel5]|uniref:cupin domain-containing protein n=1 Tax=Cellulosispirillum alkaliphilum TaxID=3039283 RepID=UPI002A55E8BA|nr:cupin domain-containing protein [Chitinispirillales bacterium ANBcel5]